MLVSQTKLRGADVVVTGVETLLHQWREKKDSGFLIEKWKDEKSISLKTNLIM